MSGMHHLGEIAVHASSLASRENHGDGWRVCRWCAHVDRRVVAGQSRAVSASCYGEGELAHLDSNKDKENQSLLCYRYTMGQSRRRRLLAASCSLLRRVVSCMCPSKGDGTLTGSMLPCVPRQHRIGSTDDGNARRGVGRPSGGPLPRLSSGLERLLAAPRRPLRRRRSEPLLLIVRHRRPSIEEGKGYPKSRARQASLAQSLVLWTERALRGHIYSKEQGLLWIRLRNR